MARPMARAIPAVHPTVRFAPFSSGLSNRLSDACRLAISHRPSSLTSRGAPAGGEVEAPAAGHLEVLDGAAEGDAGVAAVEDGQLVHVHVGAEAVDGLVRPLQHAGQVLADAVAPAADLGVVPGDHGVGVEEVSSRSMSPAFMASSSAVPKGTQLVVGRLIRRALAAPGGAQGRQGQQGQQETGLRSDVFMVTLLGQGRHPMEKVDHVLVGRPEACGFVTGGAQTARLLLEISEGEQAAEPELERRQEATGRGRTRRFRGTSSGRPPAAPWPSGSRCGRGRTRR